MLNLKEKDKQQHLVAGIIITAVAYPFAGYLAVVIAIVVGLLKEYVYDELSPESVPDIWDAVATALGAVLTGGVIFFVRVFLYY